MMISVDNRRVQAQHHRVDLRHASPQMYDSLADPEQALSVHLFPGLLWLRIDFLGVSLTTLSMTKAESYAGGSLVSGTH